MVEARLLAGQVGSALSHTSDFGKPDEKGSFVAAAVAAVLGARHAVTDMAYFAARDTSPAAVCEEMVAQSDVYVGIIGLRYGSPVRDRPEVSYTELEFEAAGELGQPRLIFLIREDSAHLAPADEPPDLRARQDAFRARLLDAGLTAAWVDSPAELELALYQALVELGPRRGADDRDSVRQRGRPWMAPPLERMVERPELGDQLLSALTRQETSKAGPITALYGAGGYGKTRLATWACHRPEIDRRYPGGLLWLTLGQNVHAAELAERINDLAFVLSGERPVISEPNAAGGELGRLLDERAPALLVVDDVWEDEQLRPLRIGGRACTRLVTTRVSDILPLDGQHIRIDAMTDDQARLLTADGVDGLPVDAVDRLSRVAGRWPVLLNLVNGALRRRVAGGQPPEQAAEQVLRQLAEGGPSSLDPTRPVDRSRAVAANVAASLALLDSADRQRYLDLAIFPEDIDVPLDVLGLLWPRHRVDGLCDDLFALGLVAEYRWDHPGRRLVLHDVIRAYLRSRSGLVGRRSVHRRLLDAAAALLPAREGEGPTPWWTLPEDADYLWRFLPYHLDEADTAGELAALVCDLRWVEGKTRHFGSVVGVEADLTLVDAPAAHALRTVLRKAAPLLGPIAPPSALGATLASRLYGVTGLEAVLDSYRAFLPRPRLEPASRLPDQANATQQSDAIGHTGTVTSCAFSPDGRVLITASDDGTARSWRVPEGTQFAMLRGHTGGLWACTFSRDGTLLATASDDRTVQLWRMPAGVPVMTLTGHADWVRGCAFSPDGRLLATASNDGTVRISEVAGGTALAVFTGHSGWVTSCAFSPDGSLLATTGDDQTVRLWRMPAGTDVEVLTGHTDRVWSCAFSPDGSVLATAGDDGAVRLWRLADPSKPRVLSGHTDRVWSCAFSPNGTLLATASPDGTVRLWQLPDGIPRTLPGGHPGEVYSCAFSPDGTMLATTGNDQAARLWRVADGVSVAVMAGPVTRRSRCVFSADGTLLAVAGPEGAVELLQARNGSVLAVLTGHTGWVTGCSFSPDGTLLATVGHDGSARLWNVRERALLRVLSEQSQRLLGCAFSPDGTLLAIVGGDPMVQLRRVADGRMHLALSDHEGRVNGCAFSPDGTMLATAGANGTAHLWRIPEGTSHAVLSGHADEVDICTFSPDGATLATASDDGTVRLWGMPDATLVAVLTGHTSWIGGCAFSPDSTMLASVGRDGTVRLWLVASGRCDCALRVASPLTWVAWHPASLLLCAVGGAGVYLLTYRP